MTSASRTNSFRVAIREGGEGCVTENGLSDFAVALEVRLGISLLAKGALWVTINDEARDAMFDEISRELYPDHRPMEFCPRMRLWREVPQTVVR